MASGSLCRRYITGIFARINIFKNARFHYLILAWITIPSFQNTFAQSLITSDGLNNSSTVFTLANGAYFTGNTDGNDEPTNSPFASEGSHSRGISNGNASLTSGNINTIGYTNIYLDLRAASFGITGGGTDGADNGDYIRIEISPNGGTNYYNTLTVTGNTNAYWAYSSGTGVASTVYDGDANTVTFSPAAGGNRTTDGYSTIRITGLPSVNNLVIRITLVNNSNAERWCIDDFRLMGTRIFYSGGNLPVNSVNSWWTNADGTGSHPANFTSGDIFVVQSGHQMTTTGIWSVSGVNSEVRIGSDASITASNEISISANTAFLIEPNGLYNHNNNTSTVWNGTENLDATSTVNYGLNGPQTVASLTYGNLSLSGSGLKTINAVTTVTGRLSMEGTATASAAPTFGANASLRYMGSAAQVTGPEFPASWTGSGGVFIENANGLTLNAAKNINNRQLTIGSTVPNSVFNDGGYQLTGTGTLNMTSGTFRLGSASAATTLPAFGTFNLSSGTTIEYASGVAQNISSAPSYQNLTLSGAGTKTAGGNLNIGGAFSASGGILNTANNINFNGTTACGGIINATGGTVAYASTATNIIAGTYNNLTIGGASSLCGDITVNGTLTVNGQLECGTYNLTVNNAVCGSGSIRATGGTITYSGTTSVLPGTYNNLTVTGGAIATLCSGTTNVTGTLDLQGATVNIGTATLSAATVNNSNTNTINISSGTFTVNSDLSLSNADPITFSGAGFLNVSGDLSCGALTGDAGTISVSGDFNPNSLIAGNSTVVFNGSGIQTIPAFDYYNLTSNSTGSRTLASSGTIGVAGTFTPGANSYTVTGSTIDFNGTAAQPVALFTYNNLNISGSNTKTISGNIAVNNNLSVAGTATLASDIYQITGSAAGSLTMAAGTTLSLGNTGDNTNVLFPLNYTGVSLDAASTVIYQNSDIQTVAGWNYGNLTINGGGVKSLSGNASVQSVLTLSDGNVSLGNFNLTVLNPLAGSFDGSHMVVTGGSGALIKNGSIAQASMVFPVGTGAKYTPVTLSGTAGAATGNIHIRAIDGTSPNMAPGSAALSKYWEILTPDYLLNSGNVTFSWHPTEALGDASSFSLAQWTTGPAWMKRSASLAGNSLTHSLSVTVAGEWTTTERATLYSYNTGNWHTASTWTTDPTGTELVGSRVPQDDDRVVILNGYTVTLTQSVSTTSNTLRVEAGAILNIDTCRFYNALSLIEGSGTIQSSRATGTPATGYFPVAATNTFVNADGGTYEYNYDGAQVEFNLPTQSLYNNLKINTSAGKTAILAGNLDLNGNLLVSQGTLRINDGSALQRTITVNGDIEIASSGSVMVSSGNVTHSILAYGDLSNEGTLDLTNNADFAANTLGAANISFAGNSSVTVNINNTTSFYGFQINKGSDQSLTVEVVSPDATSPFDGITGQNVITLTTGTLKLGENITITRLRGDVNNYDISTSQDGNAGLWINGADVTLGTSAIVVYGNLRISRGSFNAMGVGQGTIVTREGGSIYIEGGTLTANQIRPSNTAVHTGSFIQTGGTVNVNGPATTNSYPVFAWPFPESQFHMSGGTLNVSSPTAGGAALNGGILIGVGTDNYSITGGTVNINIPASAVNFNINSTIPFWNLTINKAGAGTGTATLAAQPHGMVGVTSPVPANPLVVLNNLTVNGTNNPALNASGTDVTIGGDFNISSGGTYTPGSNSTVFNGTGAQSFGYSGTITSGLNKLNINKISGTVTLSGTQGTFTVLDSLIITAGTLNDGGKTIDVAGNIYTAGTHTGTGKIVMNSNGLRTIEASIFGTPSLGNLEINNANVTAGFIATQLLSDLTVESLVLTSNHIFDINIYGLTVNTNPISGGAFSATRMIRTSGISSDGGLTIGISLGGSYTNNDVALFPVGTDVAGTNRYTPGKLRINGSPGATSGLLTVIPVDGPHPANLVAGFGVLPYYWKTRYSGFAGIDNSTVGYLFTYYANIPNGPFFGFPPYDSYFLTSAGNFQQINNNISGDAPPDNVPFPSGSANLGMLNSDFTAGADVGGISPFNLLVSTYYSRVGGTTDWNLATTWTTDPDHDGPAAGPPTAGDVGIDRVVIGGEGLNHNIEINNTNRYASVLTINEGSSLDLNTTTGHSFYEVYGSGKLRISSSGATARFPTGSFGDFLGESGGTVEYYTTGAVDFTIPARQGPTENLTPITNYRYLELTPEAGRYITMPNSDLEIYDSVTVQGANSTSIVRLNTANSRTLDINGSLRITGGNLQFRTGNAQTINIHENISVSNGALFDVENTAGTSHTMTISGNLINNGTFDMRSNSFCNVTFNGNTSKYITGTNGSAVTDFNNLVINKGSSQATQLTVNVSGTFASPVNGWLTLANGTFSYQNSSVLNISTTNAFTIPATAALEIDNAAAVVTIIGSAASTNNLYLNGKLTIIEGDVNIGAGNGNDIEYSESGLSEINISGGSLNVSGQIRRNLASLGGILKYLQAGGNVTIQGNSADASRAKLEVLNPGSNFTHTGGDLTIVRGGGTTFGDLYIRPASHSTNGTGNIFLATASGTGNQTFRVEATVPLSSISVNGFDGSNTANARIYISPLTLTGGLSINANGTFNTNNLNLTLAGNFSNLGTFTPGTTDVTTFNGSVQTLTGNNTSFSNLTANSSVSLTLQPSSNITVNKDLKILAGFIADGGNTITVRQNLVNYTSHISSGSGRILLNGSLNQVISGNGSASPAIFGRLVLDNNAGALLQQDLTINNELILENGSVNIDDRLLTISSGASLTPGSGSFGISKMVIVNGAITTAKGITLPVPAMATTIMVPVGVNGKYTPVTITCSANSSEGSVNIIPLNSFHPTALYPTDVLQYYWQITSSGLSGFTGNIQMNYLDSDVRVTPPNTESNYISGRLIGTTWTKLPGLVDATNNISEFPFTSATSSITGDYTAGVDTALPTTVPTYYSNVVNGNWGERNSWLPVPPSGVPNGAIMVIQPGHNIILETNSKKAYKTTINGRLEVGNTTQHYLGIVDGTGILAVTEQKLPAGRYDPFFSCTGGSLEYGDGGTPKDYTMSTIPSVLRRLILTGSGRRIMPNKDLTVCELLDIRDNTSLDNSINNRTLYINGGMNRAVGAAFLSGTGTSAKVVFQGSSVQTPGTFTGSNSFNHIEVNNNSGLVLSGPVDMKGNLTLTNGNITTTPANILYMSSGTSTVSPSGGSSLSYVNGPLKKKITGGYLFHFPIGKGNRYGRASINLPDDGDWTAEYFNTGHSGMASPAFAAPLTAASTTEYWNITGPSSKEAYVTLRWDPVSDIRPAVSQLGISGMRVAELNTSTNQWNEKSTSSSGNNNNGTSTTTDKMTLGSHDYTLAVVGSVNARARFVNTDNVCIGGSIPVEFTGITGQYTYTISYTINGVDQDDITGINSSTTNIPVTVAGDYQLNGFSYNNPASPTAGIFDATTVTVNEQPSAADAGTDQTGSDMCGMITTLLNANTPVSGTGRWTVVSGTGGVIGDPADPQSTFSGTTGVTYVLRWTITNDPCTPETDEVTVSFHQAPAVTLTGDIEVCAGDEGLVYSTEAAMSNYTWSITGGTITAGGNNLSNTATVTWGTAGAGSISVNYTNGNGCDADLPTDLGVTIYYVPEAGPSYRIPNDHIE